MQYIEMTIEEANKLCKKNAIVLVAVTDLTNDNVNTVFVRRKGVECDGLFEDAKTVIKSMDDFVKKLNVFTENQDMHNILPIGMQRTILLKE